MTPEKLLKEIREGKTIQLTTDFYYNEPDYRMVIQEEPKVRIVEPYQANKFVELYINKQTAILDPSYVSAFNIRDMHIAAVKDWHTDNPQEVLYKNDFIKAVMCNHKHNFEIWHHEDIVRNSVSDVVIINAKRNIDINNQKRNDAFENIDVELIKLWPWIIEEDDKPVNTETVGTVIDRLSIASLRAYHLEETVVKNKGDVSVWAGKLIQVTKQRTQLCKALDRLLVDLYNQNRRMMFYGQHKLYNDPKYQQTLKGEQ